MSARYALYYAPGALSALHAAITPLFGRDALGNRNFSPVPPADGVFSSDVWASMVAVPAKYGLHATLKAPFELSPRWNDDRDMLKALSLACEELARRHEPLTTTPLELRSLSTGSGCFLALTPACGSESFAETNPALAALEKDCVTALEIFRAPLEEADIRRRGELTPKEASYLVRYGYHRIFDLFRFHMTLTDSMPESRLALVEKSLRSSLSAFIDRPLVVDSISLFRQKDRTSPFVELSRFSLGTNNNRNDS